MTSMQFPLMNITHEGWSIKQDLDAFHLIDPYIFTENEAHYKEYFHNQYFCACDGEIYQVTGKTPPKTKWRHLLKWLPDVFKVKLQFQSTGKKIPLEELKNWMLARLEPMDKNDHWVQLWKAHIRTARSHKELIHG